MAAVLNVVLYFFGSIGITLLVTIFSGGVGGSENQTHIDGLRNDKVSEWKVYVITLVVFSLLHLINLFAGGNITQVLVQFAGARSSTLREGSQTP